MKGQDLKTAIRPDIDAACSRARRYLGREHLSRMLGRCAAEDCTAATLAAQRRIFDGYSREVTSARFAGSAGAGNAAGPRRMR